MYLGPVCLALDNFPPYHKSGPTMLTRISVSFILWLYTDFALAHFLAFRLLQEREKEEKYYYCKVTQMYAPAA